ncbi:MAG: tRNA (adenosine(37)-N6)-threonylcarbamoyltransferase complex dimerization subunit type 1 TsaB [Candidatus Fraserbacteria bacterium RBG_16_55_9]|uniref:tRNA (Adenosine(37)-N6)-threonylcarbamoyltransferase complex dimerization subunit type 1 TsaB n=1 Tax=Fraserbacteria sp. (strain RBG_16_55_9) TaxID=1817864 RepID=A0A1F5V0F6_FRAXR|nr:MAG: tRNA (adenosine(37)-N6)-threonylcarbamoyltransferase complex dimerization subunit type 1 TsaB [Candidatus Fraserbacteria bacterium RBG_16_55_9]
MLIVGWDTGGERGSVGLLGDDRPLSEIDFSAALKQGEKLLPALDMALRLAEAPRCDIGLISVSIGPGSFTGLRIGIATAKGLARSLGIPMVGVPAVDSYARAANFWDGPVWVLLSDRRDWIYAASYRKSKSLAPVQAIALEAFCKIQEGSERTLFVGPGAEQHRTKLTGKIEGSVVASAGLNRPSGLQIASLGWEKYCRSGCDELYELEPVYLQAPLAEAMAQE